jgi:DNA-binding response OmpR family regulator
MPVLGLTANITQSDLMRFGNAGVDEIMLKPLQVERFIQSIERLMQRER